MEINAKKLEVLLARNGLNQVQLSESSGVSRQSICTTIKRGSCSPATAYKLAKALNIDVEEIIQKED